MSETQLVVCGRAWVLDLDGRARLGALANEPVLPEREAVAGRERIREDIVRERSHSREIRLPAA